MKRIYTIIIILSVLTTFIANNPDTFVYAAEPTFVTSNIRVSPVLLKIHLEPGTKHIYPISIDNLSNAPLPMHANVEGFDATDEQSGFTPNPPSEVSPLAKWITIDEPDSIIPARNSHEFLVKISIPSTVPIGGYYAIIYFTPLYPNGTIGSKIGVVTLANIGIQDSLTNKARILSFQFEKLIFEHGPITSTLRIQNDALHYFSTKPTLSVAPYWGKPDTVELDEKTILPGKSRYWKSVFTIQNSKWGIYKATIKAGLENGETITKTIPLIILPYSTILIFTLISLCILLIIMKRKNLKNAITILITKSTESTPIPTHTLLQAKTPTVVTQKSRAMARVSGDSTSRIDPALIIKTLNEQQGSVNNSARILGIHRSTIHRWKQRAKYEGVSESVSLARKSTRPLHVRTTTIPRVHIRQIVTLHTKKHMTAKQIKNVLRLSVSERTILRIIKRHTSI